MKKLLRCNPLQDMRFLGMVEHGIYADECEGMSVEDIEETYGVHGHAHRRPLDKLGLVTLLMRILATLSQPTIPGMNGLMLRMTQTCPIVEVVSTESPFQDPEHEAGFFAALEHRSANGHVPENFGVAEAEWEHGEYPVTEYLQVGRKRGRQIPINLSTEIWLPRAQLWARALELMIRSQHLLS